MKLDIKVEGASGASEHGLELDLSAGDAEAASGQAQFSFDDGPTESADWAEVTPGVYSILLGGRSYEVRLARAGAAARGRARYELGVNGDRLGVEIRDPRSRRQDFLAASRQGPQEIVAPMPGRIVKLLAEEGREVEAGDGLLVMEAMKMQNELRAARAGRVEKVYVAEGAGVETGAKLIRLV